MDPLIEEMAEALFNDFIDAHLEEEYAFIGPYKFDKAVTEKIRFYRTCMVIMALGLESEKRPRLEELLRVVEAKVFSPEPNVQGLRLLSAARASMHDLSALLSPGFTRHGSWAIEWLATVDIQETNPATLILFTHRITAEWASVVELTREFGESLT